MAKKKKETTKDIVLERTYNIPLRSAWLKAPSYKRAKRAVGAVRIFLAKHMKSDNIKIGKYLNLELWKHGIKNPPHHIEVNATKDSDGIVKAEIVGAPKEEEVKAVPKKPETMKEKIQDKIKAGVAPKKEEKKVEEEVKKTEEKPKLEKSEEKVEEKKEKAPEPVKEEKKEEPKKVEEEKKEPAKEKDVKEMLEGKA